MIVKVSVGNFSFITDHTQPSKHLSLASILLHMVSVCINNLCVCAFDDPVQQPSSASSLPPFNVFYIIPYQLDNQHFGFLLKRHSSHPSSKALNCKVNKKRLENSLCFCCTPPTPSLTFFSHIKQPLFPSCPPIHEYCVIINSVHLIITVFSFCLQLIKELCVFIVGFRKCTA